MSWNVYTHLYHTLIFWCSQFIDTVIYDSLLTDQMNTGTHSGFLLRHWHRSLALAVILVLALCSVASPPKFNLQKYFFFPQSIHIFLKPAIYVFWHSQPVPGIEIALTEKLAILKTLTTGMYVDRVSNKKMTIKERESLRSWMSWNVYTHLYLAFDILMFAI